MSKITEYEMKVSLFEKIEDWFLNHPAIHDTKIESFYFKMCRGFNRLKDIFWYGPMNFILNTWEYKSILWSDKWFDSYYFLNLIRFKLKNDAKKYRKYGMVVPADEYALQMEYCVALLDRINKDNYADPYITEHEKKWGTIIDFNKDIDDIIRNRRSHLSDEEKNQERKEYINIMLQADKEKHKDLEKVLNFLQQNVLYWWD